MAERVVLHIGPRKTGSTYLQSVLWSGRDRFARQGLDLPLGSHRRQWLASASLCGDRWGHLRDAAGSTWDHFVRAAAEADGTALLSDENLVLADDVQLDRAVTTLAPARVDVVLMARDLGRLIPSVWQQDVRTRETRTLERYAADLAADEHAPFWALQDPAVLAARWCRVLPAAQVRVVVVPPRSATELWRRFAAAVGPGLLAGDPVAARPNESFDGAATEVLRRLNETLGDRLPMQDPYVRAVRHGVVAAMHDVADAKPRGSAPRLSPELRPWLVDRTRRVCDDLDALGVEVVGDLAELGPEPGDTAGAAAGTSEAEIATAAVDTLAAFAVRFDALAVRAAELEDRVTATP